MTVTDSFFIALGGNLPSEVGSPAKTLRAALAALEVVGADVQAVSRFYATPCFPAGAGPDYVNAAAQITFDATSAEMLEVLHRVEAQFGRERVQRWGRRTLDLDLIAHGAEVLPNLATFAEWRSLAPDAQMERTPDVLILPHPRMHERPFVLIPLADIAPDWRHPVLGRTVGEMVQELPPDAVREVVALA